MDITQSTATEDQEHFLKKKRSALLIELLKEIESNNIQYCILSGYTTYPEYVPSDVDILVSSKDYVKLPKVLSNLANCQLVHYTLYEAGSISFRIVALDDLKKPICLQIDISKDFRYQGAFFLTSAEILERRQRLLDSFWIPSAEIEFIYYLIKKISKAALSGIDYHLQDEHTQKLSRLYKESPEACQRQLARFFPQGAAQLIAQSAHNHDWEAVQNQMQSLRQIMLKTVRFQNPWRQGQYYLSDLSRRWKRVLQPPGVMVVFLGADGSGKSTVIAHVEQDFVLTFRKMKYVHLRPKLGMKSTEGSPSVLDPHGQPLRSYLISIFKILYFWFDYTFGYLLKILPQLFRPTLVLFDRYFHDLLVDTRRYRYGGPVWLAKLIGKIIPGPDLWFLLDAPAAVLQERKQEVSFEETARQRDAYVHLVQQLPNGHIIDSAQTVDQVSADVNQIILSFMVQRTRHRLGL